jgi:hypothetical protein
MKHFSFSVWIFVLVAALWTNESVSVTEMLKVKVLRKVKSDQNTTKLRTSQSVKDFRNRLIISDHLKLKRLGLSKNSPGIFFKF